MQTGAQAAAVAYDNELRAAERHMEESEGPDPDVMPMTCRTCAHFHHLHRSEDKWAIVGALPDGFENRMNFARMVAARMGVCELRFDDPGGMLYEEDNVCDPDEGYEEATDEV